MEQLSVILFGGYESYKTKLRKVFCKQQYAHSDSRIIGVQYSQRILQHQHKNIKFRIWDTPEQDRYKTITSGYQKASQCIIYVYEASRKQSFDEAIQFFADSIKLGNTNKVTMLVEYVLDSDKRVIPLEKGAKFAEQNGMMFHQILDNQPKMIDKMFKRIATQVPLREIVDKIYLFFGKKMDKDGCLDEIHNIFDKVRNLGQIISEFQGIVERDKVLSEEIKQMQEHTERLQLINQEANQKLKYFDQILKNLQINTDIYDVIGLYEKKMLQFTQAAKEIQAKLIQRCQTLEKICDNIDSITKNNASTKLQHMRSSYNNYRLFNCYEESIEMVRRQESQISRMSNILQGLNRSSILQFDQ